MSNVPLEMRHAKRVPVTTLISLRKAMNSDKVDAQSTVINVSMAGVYFKPSEKDLYQVGDSVICMASIGPEHRRNFPFVRIAGKARVVRIDEGAQGQAIALSFADDITLLAACP